jgi:hypothetical protein
MFEKIRNYDGKLRQKERLEALEKLKDAPEWVKILFEELNRTNYLLSEIERNTRDGFSIFTKRRK